jgi:hypothetical protein
MLQVANDKWKNIWAFLSFRCIGTHLGVNSSRESSVGNSSVVWVESTSSEADDSANRAGSRSSSPLQVRTIIRAEEPVKLQQT